MTELGESTDPVALIPGSVTGIHEFVTTWRGRARLAGDVAAHVRNLSPAGWEGGAADGFAARLPDIFAQWNGLQQSLTAAADALDQYATVLGWAQQKADDAIAMWKAAQAQTDACIESYRHAERLSGDTGVLPIFEDAGASMRVDARSLLAYARSEVRDAGDAATSTLQTILPPEPLTWDDVGTLLMAFVQTQAIGQWNVLADIVNATASAGNAMLRNPDALLALLGGAALMTGGGAIAAGGAGLAATGVGSIPGGAVAAAGAGAAMAGGAVAGAGASKIAADAFAGGGVMLMEKNHGVDRGDGRDDAGHFAHGQDAKPWVDKEKLGLDEVEEEVAASVERQKTASMLAGSEQRRFFDGFFKNPDGTYTAIEVKSGSAFERYLGGSGKQRTFDDAISSSNPATATLNGEKIVITRVRVKVMP